MKAKKLIGVVAGAALTMSTVFGSAMPVFADAVDASTPEITTQDNTDAPDAAGGAQEGAGQGTQESAGQEGAGQGTQESAGQEGAGQGTQESVGQEGAGQGTQESVGQEGAGQGTQESVGQEGANDIQDSDITQTPDTNQMQPLPETQSEGAGASDNGDGAGSSGDESQGEEQGAQDDGATDNQESTEMQQSSTETEQSSTETTNENSGSDGLSSDILHEFSDDEGQQGIASDSYESSQAADDTLQAYTPITLDGDFSDWGGHQSTPVNDQKLSDMDMVWGEDGGLCIYLKEADGQWHGIATNTGHNNNGLYVITSDTGREFVFQLKYANGTAWAEDGKGNRLDGITVVCKEGQTNDANGQYRPTGNQYEIKVNPGVFKTYNQSVSLGYYLTDGQTKIIQDVANPAIAEPARPGELVMDGEFGDWDSYQHQIIEYTQQYADSEGALYSDGDTLLMHVRTYKDERDTRFYNDITVRFNENDSQCVNLKLVAADEAGNLYMPYDLWDQTPGKTYTYYLIDENGWGIDALESKNIYSDRFGYGNGQRQQWLYGKIIVKVTATGTEMEVESDLAQFADRLNLDRTNLKRIEAYYENIGHQWISCAGTSSGPVPGILMGAGIAVLAAWGYKKKEKGEASEQG